MSNRVMKYIKKYCSFCEGTGQTETVNPIWLRSKREQSGLSLREVARRLSISASYLSDIENGKRFGNDEITDYYSLLPAN